MGFSTFDSLINALTSGQFTQYPWNKTLPTGVAAGFYTSWASAGLPPAGDYAGTALAAQQVTGSTAGAIAFANPPAGKTRHLLSLGAASVTSNATGQLFIYDRLLYYPGISHATTSGQTLDNTNTLPRYTDGVGVMAWLEVTSALGGTAHNCTLTYTDDAGNTGNSTGAQTIVTSSAVGRLPHNFLFFPLAAGDKGVRSVQTVTMSASSSGTSALVLGVPLAVLPITAVNVYSERDLVTQLASLPQVKDGAALNWLVWWNAAPTTPLVQGFIQTAYN